MNKPIVVGQDFGCERGVNAILKAIGPFLLLYLNSYNRKGEWNGWIHHKANFQLQKVSLSFRAVSTFAALSSISLGAFKLR